MTDQSVRFKRLTQDAESLQLFRQLNGLFADAFEETDTYLRNKPSDDYLLSLLTKDHFIVCVALADDCVAGGLVAYALEKFE
ncbi:hypothetical protein [Planococcus sp. ISL-109]|uniref:hypothetical protein n=1 Tax=Planococcus sp. ISL-109 TaxID=2819166 RepID=UPI002551E375|nr:hypothetical protein [Planococcus sp. ISL-109]